MPSVTASSDVPCARRSHRAPSDVLRPLLTRSLLSLPVLAGAWLFLAPPLAAQHDNEVSDMERLRAGRMLNTLEATLREFYYDSTFRGLDLERLAGRAQSVIDTASRTAVLLGALAQFMQDLHDSHTRFVPPQLTTDVDYGFSWKVVGLDCFVSEVSKGSDAEAQGLGVGDRLLAIDGIKPTRENSGTISYVYGVLSPHAGLRVLLETPDGQKRSMQIAAKVTRRPQYLSLQNLEQVRYWNDFIATGGRLEHRSVVKDSVYLWRFSAFGYRDGNLDKHMHEARKYPWLLIDLRGNGGGAVEGVTRLLGHFFADSIEVFEQRWRDSTSKRMAYPRGKEPYAGQVLILTDAQTASSAEITARVLQRDRGAMVVGDRTMGAAVVSIVLPLSDESSGQTVTFGAQVSVYDIVLADGNRLEGNGVLPNVAALPTGKDLAAGNDPAMQFALELAGVQVTAAEAATIWK